MKTIVIILLISLLINSLLIFLVYQYPTRNYYKNYIIKNSDKIKFIKSDYYELFEITDIKGYYKEISIRLEPDGTYNVVYWGNRDSFLWKFKSDYIFNIDLSYDKCKGKDITKDLEIIEILINIKK